MCVLKHVQRSACFFWPVKKLSHRSRIRGVKFEPPQNNLGGPIVSKDTVCVCDFSAPGLGGAEADARVGVA